MDSWLSDLVKIGVPSLVSVVVLVLTNSAAKRRQVLENRLSSDSEKEAIVRVKREEFLFALFSFRQILWDYFTFNRIYLSSSDMEYMTIGEKIQESIPRQKENAIKIEMYANLYLNSIRADVASLILTKDEFIQFTLELVKRKRELGTIGPQDFERLTAAYQAISEQFEKLVLYVSGAIGFSSTN